MALAAAKGGDEWVIDSGCTDHMTNNYANMVSYTRLKVEIVVGKGTIAAAGYGDARIATFTAAAGSRQCTFTRVIHVPGLAANLLSTEALRAKKVYYRTDY